MLKKIKVGVMPWGIDFLMLPSVGYKNFELVYLVARETVEEKWVKSFLEEENIFLYDLDREKECLTKHGVGSILKYSNILEVVKKNKIDRLWFLTREIDCLRNWNEKNDNKIIIVNPLLKKNLENKIWFDSFLKKNKFPKPESEIGEFLKSELKLEGKLVVQKPESTGSEGTFFIKDRKEFKKLIVNNKIGKSEKCLVRKKINGETYAITIFVSSENIALSALRQQCMSKELVESKRQYLGIQWISSDNIVSRVEREINRVFKKMGKFLYEHDYFGLTSFDFMIDNSGKIYILECNPRLTVATAQLIKFPELISNLDSGGTFVDEFIGSGFHANNHKIHHIPKCSFEGSIMNIDFDPKIAKNNLIIEKEHKNGIYELQNNKIIFKTPDVRSFNRKSKQFIFTSMVKKGEIYKSAENLASIISNFRLYNQDCQPNKDGRKILEIFKY